MLVEGSLHSSALDSHCVELFLIMFACSYYYMTFCLELIGCFFALMILYIHCVRVGSTPLSRNSLKWLVGWMHNIYVMTES